ncbi:flagellar biosynthetic protein FliO [Pelagibacterium sp. HS1C4-1]|nr:flagellar biosynthetic protein FliO [Pelagibacterium xiamenense]MCD7059996.1 flagellar biosynthetic protein FliO [Pelagibacterium xiamenense]
MANLLGFENNYLTAILALGIVIVLIVLGVWLVKLLGDATRSVGRNRNRRLMLVDSVALDQKRQALLIRRDNVEHLIVTGGPNDLVVETGIEPPAQPAMPRSRRLRNGNTELESAGEATETSDKPVARLRAIGGRKSSGSLRHTGFLRSAEGDEPQLGGGKTDNTARVVPDSAKTGSEPVVSEDDRPQKETEPAHGEFAEDGAKNR